MYDCDTSCLGKTGRKLKTRLLEHHRCHIRRNTSQLLQTIGCIAINEFDWEKMKVLDVEKNYNKSRKIKINLLTEMIHINNQSNSLNVKNGHERF